MAEIFKLTLDSEKEILTKTVACLKNSGIAIIPTDTVYGLVCDGENEKAKQGIYLIKGRDYSKPLIGFVRDIEKAKNVAIIPERFFPFISNRWPGRHTFVFKSKVEIPFIVSREKTIGLRIPDFDFVRNLCLHFSMIASTSANISQTKSAFRLHEIDRTIIENVSIVVEGFNLSGKESAIWDMTEDIPKLIRGRILFVCSGNSCRSPMAQAITEKMIGNLRIEISSAGTDTSFYNRASQETIEVLKEVGIDITHFVSSSVTEQMLAFSDLIFVMEEKHKERILQLFPQAYDKTFVLNVPDPAGGNIFHYREIRDIITDRIKNFVLTRIKK